MDITPETESLPRGGLRNATERRMQLQSPEPIPRATLSSAAAGIERGGNGSAPHLPSLEGFVQRLSAEVAAAAERVRVLQAEAAKSFVGQELRGRRFVAVADRIHAILLPRLEAFTKVEVFQDFKQSVALEPPDSAADAFHGRTTTLTVPFCDKRPAPMELSFRLAHDGPVANAILEYRLRIIPIYITFVNHDQLVVPFDDLNEVAIATWIDDKLLEFTRTYFQVYFHDEYQKASLEMDPVIKVRFPRAFAVGKQRYQEATYFFYTQASFDAFAKSPSAHVA